MLFDIGWPELLLIGAVALVVIGPKDLPRALRVAGFWVRKARTMSREFQSSIDQMIRDAELDEVRKDLQKATEFDIDHEIRKTVDPTGSLGEALKPPEIPDYFDASAPELDLAGGENGALPAPALAEIAQDTPPEPAAADEPELPFAEPLPARQPEPSKS